MPAAKKKAAPRKKAAPKKAASKKYMPEGTRGATVFLTPRENGRLMALTGYLGLRNKTETVVRAIRCLWEQADLTSSQREQWEYLDGER